MFSFASLFRLLAVAALALAAASSARAQATRTWVSSTGDDVNPCNPTEPCRTFAGAISKTARDGIIDALGPGGYGTVTITKSITIDGSGTLASVLLGLAGSDPNGSDAIKINITDEADVRKTVRLRHLDINGASVSSNGIKVLAASSVHVEDCRIDGFLWSGIDASASTAAGVALDVSRTTIRQSNIGIRLSGDVTAVVDSCELKDNKMNGLDASNGAHATVSNSTVSHNVRDGLVASRSAYINAAHNCLAHNGGAGVRARSYTAVRLAGNSIFANDVGIAVELNATVASDGTNRVGGNNSSQQPNATLPSM